MSAEGISGNFIRSEQYLDIVLFVLISDISCGGSVLYHRCEPGNRVHPLYSFHDLKGLEHIRSVAVVNH